MVIGDGVENLLVAVENRGQDFAPAAWPVFLRFHSFCRFWPFLLERIAVMVDSLISQEGIMKPGWVISIFHMR